MKRKIMLLMMLMIIVLISLTGCKKGAKGSSSEPEEIKEEDIIEMDDILASDLESVISEEETPFTKVLEDGETVYLDEESPEILTVEMFLAEYGEAKFNVDYKESDGREIQDYLTPERLRKAEEEKEDKEIKDMFNELKVIEHFISVYKLNSIQFKGNTAKVDVEFSSVYESVETEEGCQPGVHYYKPEKLMLKKVDNKWKIDSFLELGDFYYMKEEGE